ncbi:hypothetical protein OIU77_018760 [Salix suchowensis]|uniref:Secreted protein n=1 Tax=Salix suchowensis TaxID=1278906 RepID=A0ABQ9CHK1_9ROSI|nr:hypothetical protein OIU78_021041 [Salix suchowensis]KAJ6397813.1 hypothetical protein OIU77_018760 [Salix suchowensis]
MFYFIIFLKNWCFCISHILLAGLYISSMHSDKLKPKGNHFLWQSSISIRVIQHRHASFMVGTCFHAWFHRKEEKRTRGN